MIRRVIAHLIANKVKYRQSPGAARAFFRLVALMAGGVCLARLSARDFVLLFLLNNRKVSQ
jgi:hypothetical protein